MNAELKETANLSEALRGPEVMTGSNFLHQETEAGGFLVGSGEPVNLSRDLINVIYRAFNSCLCRADLRKLITTVDQSDLFQRQRSWPAATEQRKSPIEAKRLDSSVRYVYCSISNTLVAQVFETIIIS